MDMSEKDYELIADRLGIYGIKQTGKGGPAGCELAGQDVSPHPRSRSR